MTQTQAQTFANISDAQLTKMLSAAADNCVKVSKMTDEERTTSHGKGMMNGAGWSSAVVAMSLMQEQARRATSRQESSTS